MADELLYVTLHPTLGIRVKRPAADIVALNLGYYRLTGDPGTFTYRREWVKPSADPANPHNPALDAAAERYRPLGGRLPLGTKPAPIVVVPPPPVVPAMRERDPSKINWGAAVDVPDQPFSGMDSRIKFLGDGTIELKGNFRQPNADRPTVKINTARKVFIRESNLLGYAKEGGGAHIIRGGRRVYPENTIFFSGNPNVDGHYPGRSVAIEGFYDYRERHCEHYGTGGVYLQGWAGSNAAGEGFGVYGTLFRNIDGRKSAGPGLWRSSGEVNIGFKVANAFQVQDSYGMQHVRAEYFEMNNDPNGGYVEDWLSFYRSTGGGLGKEIMVREFISKGAFPYDPNYDGTQEVFAPTSVPYSGGGGLAGDNLYGNDEHDRQPSYITFEDYLVTGCANYATGIAAGHHNTLRRFRVIRSGWVRAPKRTDGRSRIGRNHLALQISDYALFGNDLTRWYANHAEDALLQYTFRRSDGTWGMSNGYDVETGLREPGKRHTETRVTRMTTPATLEDEEAAEAEMRERWKAAGVVIGCVK